MGYFNTGNQNLGQHFTEQYNTNSDYMPNYNVQNHRRIFYFYVGFKTAVRIYKDNLIFILRKPFLLVPIIVAILSSLIINLYIFGEVSKIGALSSFNGLVLLYLSIAISTMTISIALLFIVGLLKQHEETGRMSFVKAFSDLIRRDLWRALPIIIFWSMFEFVLRVFIMVLGSRRKNKSISGRGILGIVIFYLKVLQVKLRMTTMFAFTISVWDEVSSKVARYKATNIYNNQFYTGEKGYIISYVVSLFSIIPMLFMIFLMMFLELPIFTIIFLTLIYHFTAMSFGKVIEQLYISELYLWYKKYDRICKDNPMLSNLQLEDITKPTFIDDNMDLEKDMLSTKK